ncbi:hypothetical protein QR680_005712 [Steinernema hermaphroditum]|uniref:Mitochondrial thiamine pyrophosphate carrier n=1 Tax=Steinernema hermaphroditum TaxID=289476 RepID=A0AA39HU66_9BILA|nr:hypothetical protein QR680_005712 [Steinernema hermaphroditum]
MNDNLPGNVIVMVLGHGSHKNSHKRELSSTEHSAAGLVSGTLSRACIQPLDVLKIRFQLQEEPLHGRGRGKYWGVLQATSLIRREEGARALWKGHVPAQGLSACYGIVQFTSFDFLSWHANRFPIAREYGMVCDFACGAMAGSLAMTTAMPLDVIRTRLVAQSEPKIYRGTGHAVLKIWQREGVSGYFKGLTPSLLQIAPYTGLQFSIYNVINSIWMNYIYSNETSSALVSGAVAGSCAKTILYPLDMVRHRLQIIAGDRSAIFGRSTQHNGLIASIVGIARRESFLGLFKERPNCHVGCMRSQNVAGSLEGRARWRTSASVAGEVDNTI